MTRRVSDAGVGRPYPMTIGVYSFEMHLPGARSLKDKRQVLRRLKDRLRARFNVSVAEIDGDSDLWQRAGLMVVAVAGDRDALERLFEGVHREAEANVPGPILETGVDYLDAADGGARGWNDEEWS